MLIGLGLWSVFKGLAEGRSLTGPLVLLAVTSTLGLGLIWRNFWAQRFTAALCVLAAIVLPVGCINPFAAMDSRNPPTLRELLYWMIPAVVGLLAVAWLIEPPWRRQPNNRWRGP
jgi:hypothetical protein